MWYRKGTVTLINGSKTVTGNSTYWLSATDRPAKGDAFTFDNQTIYEITAIHSDGQLVLDREYEGIDATGYYAIIRHASSTTNTRIAQQVSETLDKLGDKITVSTTAPSAGQGRDGDIWLVVAEQE